MKINRKQWLAGLALGLGMAMSGSAMAGISATKHNLGSGGAIAGQNQVDGITGGTAEICVFCHTPHAAQVAPAPLWNKNLPNAATGGTMDGGTYALYSSSTMQGTSELNNNVSISHACLSCHDGTQAMDNIVNAPTTSTTQNYNVDGGTTGNKVTGRAWSWAGTNVDVGGEGLLVNNSIISMLGTDLSNDHPVGIPYGGGATGDNWTDGSMTTVDPDFKSSTAFNVDGTNYWIDSEGTPDNVRDKSDMILFWNETTTDANVECASCHDVHDNTNTPFLRMSNANSALCLACHTK